MPRRRQSPPDEPVRRPRPAATPQDREEQLISLAYDLAEKRIVGGDASAQEVVHFLRLGSSRERLEQIKLGHENELLQVKKQHIESQQRSEEMFAKALKAMRTYQGDRSEDDEESL